MLVILVYTIHFYVQFFTSPLPPGPIPLPVIGNLHQLRGMMHEQMMKIGEKYGNVYTLYIGMTPHIVMFSYQVFKETYIQKSSVYSGRALTLIFRDAETRDGEVRGTSMF